MRRQDLLIKTVWSFILKTEVSDFVAGAVKKNEGESKNEMGIGLYYTFADFLNIRSMLNGFRSWTR